MIKDRMLKIKVVEYYIRNYWYPQMEVEVLSKHRISSAPKFITDIDVLGLVPDSTGLFKKVLGDCKTLKNQSPIARSLWMKGLMEYCDAATGIIILTKAIEKEHQLSSSILNVQLLSEEDFDLYARTTSIQDHPFESALGRIENWDRFFEIESRFPNLKSFLEYSKINFWNQTDANQQLRSGISILRQNKGEFDPSNTLHLAGVLNHISLIAIALNNIIWVLLNKYLAPRSKEELNEDLKILIYGGKENYEFLNNLRKKFAASSVNDQELTLPEWDLFLEVIRLSFEQPRVYNVLPLYLKEIAFGFLDPKQSDLSYSKTLISLNPQVTNFAIRLSEYVVKSTGLPKEFLEIFNNVFAFS